MDSEPKLDTPDTNDSVDITLSTAIEVQDTIPNAEIPTPNIVQPAIHLETELPSEASVKTNEQSGYIEEKTKPFENVKVAAADSANTQDVAIRERPLLESQDGSETGETEFCASGLVRPRHPEDQKSSPPSFMMTAMNPTIASMMVDPCDCKHDGDDSLMCSDSELSLKSDNDEKGEKFDTTELLGVEVRNKTKSKSPTNTAEDDNPAEVKKAPFLAAQVKADAHLGTRHFATDQYEVTQTEDKFVAKGDSKEDISSELRRVESFMIDETTIVDPTPSTNPQPQTVEKGDLNFHGAFAHQSQAADEDVLPVRFETNDESLGVMDETTNDDTCDLDLDFNIASSVTEDMLQPSVGEDIKPIDPSLPTPKKRGRKPKVVRPRPPVGVKKKKVEPALRTLLDDESRGSSVATTPSIRRNRSDVALLGESRSEPVTACSIVEYVWPPYDPHAENWVLQEQISEFMDVKSFKRRYPKIWRRPVEPVERDNLIETGVVTEKQCDLGLTALRVSEVLDILYNEFPDKYDEYQKAQRERKEALRKRPKTEILGPNVDYRALAMRDVISWNAAFNKDRREKRACAFDLQTFQIHRKVRPVQLIKKQEGTNMYPVALLPGQFQDSTKYYSAAELKSMPLNTVVAEPPPEALDDGSPSDSDESSSSDDSSSTTSSDDTQNDETASDAEPEDTYQRPGAVCKICEMEKKLSREFKPVPLIHCTKCDKSVHMTCVSLTVDMYSRIKECNSWMCTACRVCCICNDPFRLDANNEQRFANCGLCDRNYHLKCCGLKRRPDGRWHCQECAKCTSCGVTKPCEETETGHWHHETRRLADGTRVYFMTLCVRCLRLWKRGRVCPVCHKCFIPPIKNYEIIDCCSCQRKIHTDCVKHLSDIEKRHYNCPKCILKGKRGPVFLPKFGFGFTK